MGKILIKNDVFNIVKRLKKIDKNYFIVYNLSSKKYEVHHSKSKHSLQLVLPFDFLDTRTLNLVLKSNIKNHAKLLKEMEENNLKLEQNKTQKIVNEATFKAKEMLKFAESKPAQDVNFNDSYTTKWI